MSPTTTFKQSEGFAVPQKNLEQDNIESKKAKPCLIKEWRGRQIYNTKSTLPSEIFSIVMSAITILAGALLFSARPIIGGLIIALGIKVGYESVEEFLGPNRLKEALKVLINQDDLNLLPEMAFDAKLRVITHEAMTHDVMAYKINNKTSAVVIKYFNPLFCKAGQSEHHQANCVHVFSFDNQYDKFSTSTPETPPVRTNAGGFYLFQVSDSLRGTEANMIESYLKHNS